MLSLFLILLFSQLTYADHIDLVKSTCRVYVQSDDGQFSGTGWTVKLKEDKTYIITAAHVIDKKNPTFKVKFFYPMSTLFTEAKLLGKDVENDIAVLTVSKKLKVKALNLAEKKIELGDRIISHGCPKGNWPSMVFGRVKAIGSNYFKMSPDVIPGRSGAAIMDEEGNYVYGIVLRTNGYAISSKVIRQFLIEHKVLSK